MIKVLETAIAKIRALRGERQAYIAPVLEQIASDGRALFRIPEVHRTAILEGLAQANRGEFASDEDVDSLHRRPSA